MTQPRVRERAEQMQAEWYAANRDLPARWRLSPDVWRALLPLSELSGEFGSITVEVLSERWPGQPEHRYGDSLLGTPVVKDETLPPRSMLLE